MDIVVIGGTGLIGKRKLVSNKLRERGHEALLRHRCQTRGSTRLRDRDWPRC